MIFLDDDDLIHPRMVEEALDVLSQRPEADVVTFLWECIFTPSSLDATFPIALLFDYKRLAQHPLVHTHQRVALPKCIEQDPISALLRKASRRQHHELLESPRRKPRSPMIRQNNSLSPQPLDLFLFQTRPPLRAIAQDGR